VSALLVGLPALQPAVGELDEGQDRRTRLHQAKVDGPLSQPRTETTITTNNDQKEVGELLAA
jgi:hypothetical protein